MTLKRLSHFALIVIVSLAFSVTAEAAALVVYGLMGHFRSRKGGDEEAEESGPAI